MSGGEVEAEPDDGMVQAARRDYRHQRECIVQHLIDCGAVTEDENAGGFLIGQDHCGSEFDTLTIVDATRAFLAISDVRMRDGSDAERLALALMIESYRRVLPISPLTTVLAEVAERAVKAKGRRQGKPGGAKRTTNKETNAEHVRDIIAAAERMPGRPDLFKEPQEVRERCRTRLKRKTLDRNTLNGYREIIDRPVKIDGFHASE